MTDTKEKHELAPLTDKQRELVIEMDKLFKKSEVADVITSVGIILSGIVLGGRVTKQQMLGYLRKVFDHSIRARALRLAEQKQEDHNGVRH